MCKLIILLVVHVMFNCNRSAVLNYVAISAHRRYTATDNLLLLILNVILLWTMVIFRIPVKRLFELFCH